MCGIIGAVSKKDVLPLLVEGLKRLNYRGYDSTGVAVAIPLGDIQCVRAVGKLPELEKALEQSPLPGKIGIAHTRWATHGEPSERNAHPLSSFSGDIAVVHNGIIENHAELRQYLEERGCVFVSDTDTEVIPHLLSTLGEKNDSPLSVMMKTTRRLKGSFAFAALYPRSEEYEESILATRRGNPLVVGIGDDEYCIASDFHALLPMTNGFIFLEDDDIVWLAKDFCRIYNGQGERVERTVCEVSFFLEAFDTGGFAHFMQKEIHEQPEAIMETLRDRTIEGLAKKNFNLSGRIDNVHIIACGTSYHAGLIAKYWIESIAGLPTEVSIASEWRYRLPEPLISNIGTLFVFISQSGETADTLACLQLVSRKRLPQTLAICNTERSAIARMADTVFLTKAGVEVSVASTKAFTTQMVALMLLTISLARISFKPGTMVEQKIISGLLELPEKIEEVLAKEGELRQLAVSLVRREHVIFLGRGTSFPVALEGALKLKEIAYIDANAYPAGELKHGPIALIDADMPVLAVANGAELLDEKLASNLQEVSARGGIIFLFASESSKIARAGIKNMTVITLPDVIPELMPFVSTVALQLLAYHVAVLRGNDVDQPRNLAKSVTVE